MLIVQGMAIGLNAAFLNIVTEWLSDIKLGYCTTAFYLNENFCCLGAESGMYYDLFRLYLVDQFRLRRMEKLDRILATKLYFIHYICSKWYRKACEHF